VQKEFKDVKIIPLFSCCRLGLHSCWYY